MPVTTYAYSYLFIWEIPKGINNIITHIYLLTVSDLYLQKSALSMASI